MKITEAYVTKNPCYRAARKLAVKGLMLHSVGTPQPKAEVFVNTFNSVSLQKCVHGFIDGNTGEVYQTLPWSFKAWHCGGSGNDTHIGIEMCEPATIRYTGGSTFVDNDYKASRNVVWTAYRSAVELFAYLCRQYGLDPLKDIVSHAEGHKKGIASNHGDPEHVWKKYGFTMDGFRADVKRAMEDDGEMVERINAIINGKTVPMNRILKDGYNYIKIRDVASELGFNIEYQRSIPVFTPEREAVIKWAKELGIRPEELYG